MVKVVITGNGAVHSAIRRTLVYLMVEELHQEYQWYDMRVYDPRTPIVPHMHDSYTSHYMSRRDYKKLTMPKHSRSFRKTRRK